MNSDWFKSLSKVLFSNPGVNWYLILDKNSFKNKELKLKIISPAEWFADSDSENNNWSGWFWDL